MYKNLFAHVPVFGAARYARVALYLHIRSPPRGAIFNSIVKVTIGYTLVLTSSQIQVHVSKSSESQKSTAFLVSGISVPLFFKVLTGPRSGPPPSVTQTYIVA